MGRTTETKWLVKALWGVFLLSVPLLALIGLLMYMSGGPFQSKLSQDERLTAQLDELSRLGGSTTLRDLAGGDWDRVYVYHQEYLGRDQVERDVGAKVNMENTFARGRAPSVLVFLKGADVERATWVDLGLHPGIYTADVRLEAAGQPSPLKFVEPAPIGPHLSEDTDLAAKRSDLTRTRGSALLRDLTGGDWDRVYVVTADTQAEVEKVVGAPVEMEPIFTKRGSILVFMKDGSVQRATYSGYLPDGAYSSAVRLDESKTPLPSELVEP